MKAHPHLITLSDRLSYALELTGTRKADLARAINVKPQVIQFLCSNATKTSRFTFEIATTLKLNTRWLATGEGSMFSEDDQKTALIAGYQHIPLLTIDQVIRTTCGEIVPEKNILHWELMKAPDANGIHAIKWLDDSMSPIIPKNATVFYRSIHADHHLKHHEIVLAYLPQFNAIVLRMASITNKYIELISPNPEFGKIDPSVKSKIIGQVIQCHWKTQE